MSGLLATGLAFLEGSKYLLLFLGCYAEGSIAMMTGGFLLRLGVVDFWPLYLTLLAADFLADISWYAFGYFGARNAVFKFKRLTRLTPEVLARLERRFEKHHTWVLIISKLTMGFGFAPGMLTVAGMLRVSIVKYALINFFGGIVWVFALIELGYYFGNLFQLVPRSLQIAFVVLWIAGFIWLLRYVSRRLEKADW